MTDSDENLLLRDTAKQVQDIATLSRDVEHANNALSPIFNKEKEQKRLKQAQLIGEIGAQVMDIVRTEGELKAQKAAEAKGDSKVERPKDGDSVAQWEDYKKALTESPTYKAEMQKYGTGSDFQRAAQAATAAIQALAGGDIQKAIASGASPYLAQLVKDVTMPKDESKATASYIAANAMAHAVVGAVVAQLSGQDAAAGALGASSGELAARAIMAKEYPGKTANDLTEAEKQSVSALSTLAAGLVSGLASNSTASAASGAQSGRNAVENNFLSTEENRQRLSEMSFCGSDSACKDGVTEKFKKISDEQIKSVENCSSVDVCVVKAKEMAELQADYGQRIEELGEKLRANGRLNGADLEEWTYLHIVTPALEAGRLKAIHNAQAVGGSDEASQLAINTIAQAGATSAAGIIGAAGKSTNKTEKAVSGSLSGQPTKLPPNASAENIRSLQRENEGAAILSQNGYHVEQNPVTLGAKNPDYKINGEIFDNIAPKTNSVRNIYDRALEKVNSGQTNNVVINLADTKANVSDLQKQFHDWPIKGLDKVIVIDQSGKPIKIK
ncbi:VENN motif pre-toxin domain-containing protein [Pectobacterium peruviense]